MREKTIEKLQKAMEELRIRKNFLIKNNIEDEEEIERLEEEEAKCETILKFIKDNDNAIEEIKGYKKYVTVSNFVSWGDFQAVMRFMGLRNIETVLKHIYSIILSDETYYMHFKTMIGDLYVKI